MTDHEQQLQDLREVLSSKPGRRFIWRLLSEGNIFRRCFTGNSATYYNEGIREFTLTFYQDVMEASPDLFHLTQQENFNPQEKTDGRRNRTDAG